MRPIEGTQALHWGNALAADDERTEGAGLAAHARLAPGTRPTGTGTAQADVPASSAATAALALYAQVLGSGSLEAAARRMVSVLAASQGFTRVCFGLHERGRTRILASSHGELSDPQVDLAQRMLGAMDEAIDQGLSVSWPDPEAAPAPASASASASALAVAERISLEHAALQALLGGAVACVPLGHEGLPLGALCVQRDGAAAVSAAELEGLEQMLLLAAPALRWMMLGEMPWHRRTARDLQQAWSALRQPERRQARRLWAGAAAAFLFVALAPLQHEVGGRARIEGAEQRVLVAPTDGFVRTAHVRPGDRVRAGAPLLDLLEQDLRLERERWSSQLERHENAYAAAMVRSERAGAASAMARVAEAQSQLNLVDGQLARGRIVAPFDGLVIQGDLSQSIGAPVRQGDNLITLASTGQYRVIVEVDETDIARIRTAQDGRLALSSLPWDSQQLIVERIAPTAKAVEGRNIFEVEARLARPAEALRPGLLGRAQIVVGRKPPLWVWLQQATDRIRLAYWSWLG